MVSKSSLSIQSSKYDAPSSSLNNLASVVEFSCLTFHFCLKFSCESFILPFHHQVCNRIIRMKSYHPEHSLSIDFYDFEDKSQIY